MARDLTPPAAQGRDLTPPDAPAAPVPDDAGFWERLGRTLQAGADSVAHGMANGPGPISGLVRDTILRPGELEENQQHYEQAKATAPGMAKVGNFLGGAYSPDTAIAGQAAGVAVSSAARAAAGPVGRALERLGLGQARRVLTGGANPLAVKKPLSDAAVEAAFDAGAISPGRTTAYAADKLAAARGEATQALGRIVESLDQAGVRTPVEPLAKALEARAAQIGANSVDSEAPALYQKIADQLRQNATNGELGLAQTEAIKRSVQNRVAYDALRKATDMVSARKEIASMVRQAAEDAVQAGAQKNPALQGLADSFVPAKDQLGNLIEASTAATKGAAQAARRNMFGLRSVIGASGITAGAGAAWGPEAGLVLGPASVVATHLAETRGTPTAAWLAYKLGQKIAPAAGAQMSPAAVGAAGPVAAEAPAALAEWLNLRNPIAVGTPAAPLERGAQQDGGGDQPAHGGDRSTSSPQRPVPVEMLASHVPQLQAAAAEGGKPAMAAAHHTLAQTDENYRRLMRAVGSGGKPERE